MMRLTSKAMTFVLRGAIRAYQLTLSPVLGPRCRFAPSCSAYAAEAIAVHGPLRGIGLAAYRLCRCHPWGGEGFDPVPAPRLRCEEISPTSAQPSTTLLSPSLDRV